LSARRVLLTGATGYVGGRLAPLLLDRGQVVRCFVRDRGKLEDRPWAHHPNLEIVVGDAGRAGELASALDGCDAAYYLLHSMIVAGGDYAARDRDLARSFAAAAATARVGRIVYLGGLGETGDRLSEHLASRREVEAALASTSVPVTVLRAAMIIGSGSASFEMLRYLVERLPVMVTPRWVDTECQPIAIRDVLRYLAAVLETPESAGKTLDIGGRDVVTYRRLMDLTAEALGLRRRIVLPVPVLTPRLSSLWIHLVTPLSHRIARPLAEGLKNRVVCRNDDAARLMPGELASAEEAIRRAVTGPAENGVPTSWSDAGAIPGDPPWAGGTLFRDERSMAVDVPPEVAFRAVRRIGGKTGWYAAGLLWKARGAIDKLLGGPGLGRGRRDPDDLRRGDALDFWRVVEIEPNRRLRLRAEMRLPGLAFLELEVAPEGAGSRIVQRATFRPRGLGGLAYWFSVLPFHGFVFSRMLRGIADAARREGEGRSGRA
jgi:uncharacterized protein YbjT (DUF2867 family)